VKQASRKRWQKISKLFVAIESEGTDNVSQKLLLALICYLLADLADAVRWGSVAEIASAVDELKAS
jgi:hypothetical protein